MDSQETPINGRPPRPRRLRAAVERIVLAFEEHLVWRGGDAIRAVFEIFRRPFEWIAWALRRILIWPVQDRVALLSGPGRALAASAAVVLAAGVGVAGFAWAESGGSGGTPATPAATTSKPLAAEVATPPTGSSSAPTLHGAAPVFKPAGGKASSEVDEAKPIESASAPSSASTSSAATDRISSSPSSSAEAASTSSVDGPPAGPEAIAVARDFAGAFVVYETGGEEAQVRKTLAATATPELARSLLRRPPRLPAGVKVPKAKVVNIVAGPSQGGVYSISVSLLRVGVTSELRLDMERLEKNGWRVTNVLG
ncbi:MAG: hypothetical protein WD810_02755 [Solirubrobacterales bacterium]